MLLIFDVIAHSLIDREKICSGTVTARVVAEQEW